MNPLNPFALSGLFIAITAGPIFILLLIRGKSKVAKIFNLHILTILGWGITSFFWATLKDINLVLIDWDIAMIFVVFMPVFFYHTAHELSKKKEPLKLYFWYLQAIFFSICVLKGLLWNDYIYVFNSFYYPKATWLYKLAFIFWLLGITSGHLKLISHYREAHPKEKDLIRYLHCLMIGFLGGINNFLPAVGVNLYPWGNFLVPFHSLFIAYAILRHQLFDITVVFKKSLAYSLLILLTAFLYFIVVLFSEKFIQGFWGYKSATISILTAFTIGILFFPLHNRIQKLVDRIIFKRTTEEISKENELLRAEVLKTEKLKSVAILASGMAHEIKNPLTAIKTFSEYLPHKVDDKEFLKKFSKIVGTEVDRIDSLVSQLLEFAKPSPVELQKADINKLIQETLDFLSNKFINHNIQVNTDLAPECADLTFIDLHKMRQVFLNLFLNAIDAMSQGGTLNVVTSRWSLDAGKAHSYQQPATNHQQPDTSILITITDTGSGIAKENLSNIFDPFFTTKDTGTGLGLPITYGIIKEHGGDIKVKSEVGKGTTFILTLPKHHVT